jgi:hypothetical protein
MSAVELDPDFVHGQMQPFMENMIGAHRDLLLEKLAPKTLLLSERDIMSFIYEGIEGKEPSEQRHVELVDGARFVALRVAAKAIQRDLKNRVFSDVFQKWQRAVTNDCIQMGSLHNNSTLFETDSTRFETYGTSNRLRNDNAEFRISALNQHLPAWSKEMDTVTTSTGATSKKMFVGAPILTDFIKAVSPPSDLISLDALSVFVAYCVAKQFNINLNHGFSLGLAAQEWKTW